MPPALMISDNCSSLLVISPLGSPRVKAGLSIELVLSTCPAEYIPAPSVTTHPTTLGQPITLAMVSSLILFCAETTNPPGAI